MNAATMLPEIETEARELLEEPDAIPAPTFETFGEKLTIDIQMGFGTSWQGSCGGNLCNKCRADQIDVDFQSMALRN